MLHCLVTFVIDGDTFVCASDLHIRVWGINAPEAHDPGGPEATRELRAYILGRPLLCLPKGTSYNRLVAQCWRGPTDIAWHMVLTAHARDWPYYSKGYYSWTP